MDLPPLPFGEAYATLELDADRASALMAGTVPSMTVRPNGSGRRFKTRLATSCLGDMRLMASATTPCRKTVDEAQGFHLVIPSAGAASLLCDGKRYDLRSGRNALLMPNMRRLTERGTCSVAIASIDLSRLQRTLAAIDGHDNARRLPADRPILLSLAEHSGLFASFLQICRLIDTTSLQQGLGGLLGLDDTIYRWLAATIRHNERADPRPSHSTSDAVLDAVCDLIRAAIDRPRTLTEMETISGLSARTLQYAFRARFNCSPMEWQRRERMLDAQKRMTSLPPGETITSLAHAMGFSSSAAFATLYRRYFGETPSQTLRRLR